MRLPRWATTTHKHYALPMKKVRHCRYMEKWKSCQHLWKNDLTKIIESLKDKAPSHAKFEAKITGYTRAAMKVLGEAGDVDIDWIRIDNRLLVQSVYNESVELSTAVSTAMEELDMAALAAETSRVAQLRQVINKEPESLEVCVQKMSSHDSVT
jgi:hypothetical protein